MTVNGAIDPKCLGNVYVHEHLLVKPVSDEAKYLDYTLDDIEKSANETKNFQRSGGGTIVEMTPIYYGRNVEGYQEISQQTGVHIICTTGFHKEEFMPPCLKMMKDDDIVQKLVDEIINGVEDSGVRPGVIKFGTSYNLITKQERRIMEIVSEVHRLTGIPISTHCDKGTMGIQQAEFLLKKGISGKKILLCHIDSKEDIKYAVELCQMGVNICFDHVGRELATNDKLRINMITHIVAAGLVDNLCLSGDMGKKSYLEFYGGKPGFRYILGDLKKEAISKIGIENFDKIMRDNPQRFFAF